MNKNALLCDYINSYYGSKGTLRYKYADKSIKDTSTNDTPKKRFITKVLELPGDVLRTAKETYHDTKESITQKGVKRRTFANLFGLPVDDNGKLHRPHTVGEGLSAIGTGIWRLINPIGTIMYAPVKALEAGREIKRENTAYANGYAAGKNVPEYAKKDYKAKNITVLPPAIVTETHSRSIDSNTPENSINISGDTPSLLEYYAGNGKAIPTAYGINKRTRAVGQNESLKQNPYKMVDGTTPESVPTTGQLMRLKLDGTSKKPLPVPYFYVDN